MRFLRLLGFDFFSVRRTRAFASRSSSRVSKAEHVIGFKNFQ